MSSLTDIIFLLLIFFMLTSNFITPNGMDLVLPSSDSQPISDRRESMSVEINRQGAYRVDGEDIDEADLDSKIRTALSGMEKPTVILYADKERELGRVVMVMDIVKKIDNAQMILATTPLDKTVN